MDYRAYVHVLTPNRTCTPRQKLAFENPKAISSLDETLSTITVKTILIPHSIKQLSKVIAMYSTYKKKHRQRKLFSNLVSINHQ